MDREKFIKDCLTDYFFLEDKTRTKDDLLSDDRYIVRDHIKASYQSMLNRLEYLNMFVIQGAIKKDIFDKSLEGLAKVVARDMFWIKGYE